MSENRREGRVKIMNQISQLKSKLFSIKNKSSAYIFVAPVAIILVALLGYPIIYSVFLSFTNKVVAGAYEFIGLENFKKIFNNPVYLIALRNSVFITVLCVFGKLVLGLAGSLILNMKFRFRNIVRGLTFLPWAVSPLISGLVWKWIYNESRGILNYLLYISGISNNFVHWLSNKNIAIYSVILAMIWQGLPFYLMMLLAGLAAIPRQLYEAASIDGANKLQQFIYITLPSLKDIIAIMVMLSSIWTFNNFDLIFILTRGGPSNHTEILPTLAYHKAILESKIAVGATVMVSVIPMFLVVIYILTRKMLQDKEIN